jgi:uncharacterized protein (TIGR02145 family)
LSYTLNGTSDYKSFGFYKNGTYVIIKKATTKSTNNDDIILTGTYTIENNKLILSDFGTITFLKLEEKTMSFSITLESDPATPVNIDANKAIDDPSTFTDSRDGQTYKIVKIGTQTWFAENLNYKTTSNSWWYENKSANGDKYGRLYTWDAAITASPNGWHLPTDDEWKTLEMYLGMSQSDANTGDWSYRGIDEGKKLKSNYGWSDNGNGNNSSGFSALPGGLYNYNYGSNSIFENMGKLATFWTATERDDLDNAFFRTLNNDKNSVRRGSEDKDHYTGRSIRLVKGVATILPIVIIDDDYVSTTTTTASVRGHINLNYGSDVAAVTARGVCWSSTNTNPTITDSITTNGTGSGGFTSNLTGLTPGTKYYIRAYATNSAGTAYGYVISFTTEQ